MQEGSTKHFYELIDSTAKVGESLSNFGRRLGTKQYGDSYSGFISLMTFILFSIQEEMFNQNLTKRQYLELTRYLDKTLNPYLKKIENLNLTERELTIKAKS